MQEFSIYFNRKDCYEDLNILLKEPVFVPPNSEVIETKEIEDRNGSLTKKTNTYKDISLKITFVLPHLDREQMYYKLDEIVDWLENIQDNKLVIREDRYYIVKSVSYGDITTQALRFYEITINFVLKPFSYDLNEREIELTANKNINNKGNIYSEPLLIVTPISNITNFTITIDDKEFTIVDTVNKQVTIDCELKKCISNNLNINTSGEYPTLQVGFNNISFDSSKATIKISNVSRWR